MILGYTISITDGDIDFYQDAPDACFCPKCKGVLDNSFSPAKLRLSRKARVNDIFATYDGKTLVSERAAHFFKSNFMDFCELTRLDGEIPLYLLNPIPVVPFDPIRRETIFEDRCDACGFYEGVYGATPAFLKLTEPLPHGMYKTDIEFGSSARRNALIIFGASDKALIKKFKFHGSGVHLREIES
jgi:hypothetical protein